MRKDAKIGFAIGAVLLAVLAVYSMVVPKHGKKSTNTVTLVTPPQASAPASDGGSSAPVVTTTVATDSQPTTAPAVALATPNSIQPAPIGSNASAPMPGSLIPDASAPIKADVVASADPVRKPAEDAQPHSEFSAEPDGLTRSETPVKSKKTKARHADADTEVATASTGADRVYVVQSGQTLSSIANEIYGNPRFWVAIQRENKSINPSHLHVGDKINLPDINIVRPVAVAEPSGMAVEARTVSHTTPVVESDDSAVSGDGKTYKVKSGDNLYRIAKAELGSGRMAEELYALNKDEIGPDKSRLKLGMVLKLPAAPAHLASSMVIP